MKCKYCSKNIDTNDGVAFTYKSDIGNTTQGGIPDTKYGTVHKACVAEILSAYFSE